MYMSLYGFYRCCSKATFRLDVTTPFSSDTKPKYIFFIIQQFNWYVRIVRLWSDSGKVWRGEGTGRVRRRGRQGRRWLHLINHCINVSCKGTQGTPRDGLWPADWWWLTRGTGLRQSDPSVLTLHSSDAGCVTGDTLYRWGRCWVAPGRPLPVIR